MPPASDSFRRAVPGFAKRRHERWVTDRFLRSANALNDRYVAAHGLTVKRGPMEGLQYPAELVRDSGDAIAKLCGVYEAELYPVFEEWIGAKLDRIVDVGASEGYYAAGLALASPGSEIIAYDIDPEAQRKCATLAELNGVADRVTIEGECTPAVLSALPADRSTAVLCDCEGAELSILDPQAAPALRGWPILVELHDFIDPTISATIVERFEPTHEVQLIEGRVRDGSDLPELTSFTPQERLFALSERRPGPMRWAAMRPR